MYAGTISVEGELDGTGDQATLLKLAAAVYHPDTGVPTVEDGYPGDCSPNVTLAVLGGAFATDFQFGCATNNQVRQARATAAGYPGNVLIVWEQWRLSDFTVMPVEEKFRVEFTGVAASTVECEEPEGCAYATVASESGSNASWNSLNEVLGGPDAKPDCPNSRTAWSTIDVDEQQSQTNVLQLSGYEFAFPAAMAAELDGMRVRVRARYTGDGIGQLQGVEVRFGSNWFTPDAGAIDATNLTDEFGSYEFGSVVPGEGDYWQQLGVQNNLTKSAMFNSFAVRLVFGTTAGNGQTTIEVDCVEVCVAGSFEYVFYPRESESTTVQSQGNMGMTRWSYAIRAGGLADNRVAAVELRTSVGDGHSYALRLKDFGIYIPDDQMIKEIRLEFKNGRSFKRTGGAGDIAYHSVSMGIGPDKSNPAQWRHDSAGIAFVDETTTAWQPYVSQNPWLDSPETPEPFSLVPFDRPKLYNPEFAVEVFVANSSDLPISALIDACRLYIKTQSYPA